MSAEVLRAAARLMRKRAEGVEYPDGSESQHGIASYAEGCDALMGGPDGEHAASWHPAVALAVADWLDALASRWQQTFTASEVGAAIITRQHHALIVARAYLGDQP